MPRVPPFGRPATCDDLVKLPENLVAEIVGGELHASPRPAPRHAWLLDPAVRTLEVLRLEDARWTIVVTHAGDGVVRVEPFDPIEFGLGQFRVD
jgi:hypothetical protein